MVRDAVVAAITPRRETSMMLNFDVIKFMEDNLAVLMGQTFFNAAMSAGSGRVGLKRSGAMSTRIMMTASAMPRSNASCLNMYGDKLCPSCQQCKQVAWHGPVRVAEGSRRRLMG